MKIPEQCTGTCECIEHTDDLIDRHDFLLCSLIKSTGKKQKIVWGIRGQWEMRLRFANGWQRPSSLNASPMFLEVHAELQHLMWKLARQWRNKAPFWPYALPVLRKHLMAIYWAIDRGISPADAARAVRRQKKSLARYRKLAARGDERAQRILAAFEAKEIRLLPNRIDRVYDDLPVDEVDTLDDGKGRMDVVGRYTRWIDDGPSVQQALKMISSRGRTNGRSNSELRAIAEYHGLYHRYPDWADEEDYVEQFA